MNILQLVKNPFFLIIVSLAAFAILAGTARLEPSFLKISAMSGALIGILAATRKGEND